MTEGTAPGRPATPAVLAALSDARRLGLGLADDLLTYLPDLGDPVTQRAVDGWVEQAADTLRALAEMVEEQLIDLGRSAAGTTGGSPASDPQRTAQGPST